jgi:hypothetical protein
MAKAQNRETITDIYNLQLQSPQNIVHSTQPDISNLIHLHLHLHSTVIKTTFGLSYQILANSTKQMQLNDRHCNNFNCIRILT